MGSKMINIFNVNKTMQRLNKMIDNAINGESIENGFDETKISALETKLSHYLAMNNATKRQLKEEKLQINELISDISHQTKTPIANILLYSQLLEESNLNEQDRTSVNSLAEQAEKLNFLITSLVKSSRLEVGIITVSPKEERLQTLFDSIFKQSCHSANTKSISLKINETEISAIFDLKWTTEAVYNIIDNAIKYTPNGGKITVNIAEYEIFARIDITDTGVGINEGEISQIFSRFYRSPLVSDVEGVGIGLFLAREIISKQGGYIKVSSSPCEGSIFSVFLPKE